MREFGHNMLSEAAINPDKKQRSSNVDKVYSAILEKFEITKENETYKEARKFLEEVEIDIIRKKIVDEGIRPDRRKPDETRQITIDLDVLDNVHGSALFTRGQTQSLGIVTLGSSSDVQYIDSIESEEAKRFMLHYNFPPFCTGEVKKSLGTSRREIGHGHLAEMAIKGVLPDESEFPYVIRMVSEVLESNGSSSMATVCSSSLSLMVSGVPIKKAVAGIAMGLIWEKASGKYQVLSDIQGLEDHFGDMDFKVAGTKDGITAFQMDVKTIGITKEIMTNAIDQALAGQKHILEIMNSAIDKPRPNVSVNAPKIRTISIPESEIGSVIGGGGRVIKKIMAETDTSISIEDSGKVMISSKDEEKINRTIFIINHIVNGFDRGEIVEGSIVRIEDYGIFVELVPGSNGLLHKSNMKVKKNPKEAFKMGEIVKVKILDINERKQISLTDVD